MLVPAKARNCVLFIGTKDAKGRFRPRATGFVVVIAEHGYNWQHLVTAEHVVSRLITKGHDIWIRMNRADGTASVDPIPSNAWYYHPDSDHHDPAKLATDVAVCQIGFSPEETAVLANVPLNGPRAIVATPDVIADRTIGIGDEIFVVGLFRSHHGQQKNIPIIRIGNIAMMKDEPIKTNYCGYMEAHLIEAHSVGGLSGSPVFVNMPPFRAVDRAIVSNAGHQQLYLLGLMHGHFDIKNLNEDVVVDDDPAGSINTGIGVVVPVEKIIETIFQPTVVELRRQSAEKHFKEHGATPDMVAEESEPSTTADNPSHREDFTSLLTAAAKKKPPAG